MNSFFFSLVNSFLIAKLLLLLNYLGPRQAVKLALHVYIPLSHLLSFHIADHVPIPIYLYHSTSLSNDHNKQRALSTHVIFHENHSYDDKYTEEHKFDSMTN